MAFNPYEQAAGLVEIFGGDASTLRAAAHADVVTQSHLNAAFSQVSSITPQISGLPSVGGVHGFGVSRTPALGATPSRRTRKVQSTSRNTTGSRFQPPLAADFSLPVAGQPSMNLFGLSSGGVAASLRRSSKYTEFMSAADMREIDRIAGKMLRLARTLSQGPLTLGELARRNHPYGYGYRVTHLPLKGVRRGGLGRLQGGRRGISNMAVVNRQSGVLADSWDVHVIWLKSGVAIELINTAPHAQYTAFGTIRMKAHGPYTTAPTRFVGELNRAWARMARAGKARADALAQVENKGGSNGANP